MARPRDGRFAPLRTKVAWTLLFLVLFILGRNVPIPFVHDVATSAADQRVLDAANVATGGNFFSPSFFSLGLGPWMGAAILWRFLFLGKLARDRRIPDETQERARTAVMVVLAIVQAISLMSTYTIDPVSWGPFQGTGPVEVLIVAILVAGALLVAWLAKQNEDKGLGGITIFILYQIMLTTIANREMIWEAIQNPEYRGVLTMVLVACVVVAVIGIVAGNAELRLHVNKVAIDNGYTGVSYLPVKLNPAGAAPIMYALALLAIPQYVARAIGAVFPGAQAGTDRFAQTWGLGSAAGFAAYLVLLFVMSIFFGLLTVSPKDIAKRMRDGGEYLDGVAPGEPTRRFLRRRVVLLSALAGVVLVILTGVPLAFIGRYPELQFLLMAPGTVLIVLGLLWMLQEEIADTLIGTKYAFSFRTAPSEVRA